MIRNSLLLGDGRDRTSPSCPLLELVLRVYPAQRALLPSWRRLYECNRPIKLGECRHDKPIEPTIGQPAAKKEQRPRHLATHVP